MLFLSEGSTHADLVAMTQEDYNLDMNTESVELTYSLQQMAPDLPLIHVTSDRQVRNLLEITKRHEVRLDVDDLHGSLLVNAETYLEMMRQLHAVYGEWLLKDGCWNFVVDHFKGARMLFLSEGSTHADLVAMAQEDYNLDMNTESVELTYSLQQMAPDLPPIHVTSDRQVRNLLEITKMHEVRLSVDDLHGSLLVNAETYMEVVSNCYML
ncbi:hypothetical protein F2Q68_00020874 [Brassica cretica]|uniref:Uncharacterized protein n=1 Tax=Brassica cretica TaxID=69181 RepID=A0A8S9G115_BRACR|nr:hypothetical protein F2Q68_00020874 [Brassica cretica]